jgi:hypothetical protein
VLWYQRYWPRLLKPPLNPAGIKLVDNARQQTGTLGNFANMLGTGSQTSLAEKGSQMLSALLAARTRIRSPKPLPNLQG